MRSFLVDVTAQVPPPPAALGRLGPALARLAAQQGGWPVRRPVHVVRAGAGAGLGAGQVGVAEPGGTSAGGTSAGGTSAGGTGAALEAGAVAADRLADAGADLVLVGGGGPRVPALVLLAALLGRDPVAAVGTTPAAGWAELVAGVRDGLRRARPHVWDPPALLDAAGAEQVAGLTGLLLQCSVRRTPVLLSGAPDVWAAVLVAQRVCSATPAWLTAGCSPRSEVAVTAVTEARLVPVLDLGLDDPLGAELALGVLTAAVALVEPDAGAAPGDPDAPAAPPVPEAAAAPGAARSVTAPDGPAAAGPATPGADPDPPPPARATGA